MMIAAQTALAVTGSTGRLGSRVARGLSELGVDQRLVVRDHPAPTLPGAHIATADYDDSADVRTALTGAHTVFMVSALETLTASDNTSPSSTRLSTREWSGSSTCPSSVPLPRQLTSWHGTTGRPRHLRFIGVVTTIRRYNIYADFTPHLIGTDGNIRGPAGDGRVAVVAQADIAEAAVAVVSPATAPMTGGR